MLRHRLFARTALVAWIPLALSCGKSPTTPTPTPAATVSGTWDATATDSQGPGTMKLVLEQDVNKQVTGTVSFNFTGDPGNCNQCHRQTTGTVTGNVDGSRLSFLLNFPFGDSLSATPMCEINITGSIADIASGSSSLTATYAGEDSCMGKFADGILKMAKTR